MKRHELDAVSLTFGLVFVAIALLGTIEHLVLSFSDLRWIVPGLLVVLGLVLVLTSGTRPRSDTGDDTGDDGAEAQPPDPQQPVPQEPPQEGGVVDDDPGR